jgi:hypothetical protein
MRADMFAPHAIRRCSVGTIPDKEARWICPVNRKNAIARPPQRYGVGVRSCHLQSNIEIIPHGTIDSKAQED